MISILLTLSASILIFSSIPYILIKNTINTHNHNMIELLKNENNKEIHDEKENIIRNNNIKEIINLIV